MCPAGGFKGAPGSCTLENMKTTINVSDDLYLRAERAAAESGRTPAEVIEEAVREALLRCEPAPRKKFSLPTFGGNGPRPGMDTHSTSELIERLEGPFAGA